MSAARGFAALGLHHPKDNLNIGEVMRAAGCYSASMVAISGRRFRHSRTDTQKAWRHLPTLACDDLRDVQPYGVKLVAVEFIPTAAPLPAFTHPESAFYVFGPEDGSLPADLVQAADHVVYVPTRQCMNLACTVNVLLYDRLTKQRAA